MQVSMQVSMQVQVQVSGPGNTERSANLQPVGKNTTNQVRQTSHLQRPLQVDIIKWIQVASQEKIITHFALSSLEFGSCSRGKNAADCSRLFQRRFSFRMLED